MITENRRVVAFVSKIEALVNVKNTLTDAFLEVPNGETTLSNAIDDTIALVAHRINQERIRYRNEIGR